MFRSTQGLGYLSLADDMKSNGRAFISNNGGYAFLDGGILGNTGGGGMTTPSTSSFVTPTNSGGQQHQWGSGGYSPVSTQTSHGTGSEPHSPASSFGGAATDAEKGSVPPKKKRQPLRRKPAPGSGNKNTPSPGGKNSKWREQSSGLRQAMQAARGDRVSEDVAVADPPRNSGTGGGGVRRRSANDVLCSLAKKDFLTTAQSGKWNERLTALQDLLKDMESVPSLIELVQETPQLNLQTGVVSAAAVAPLRDLLNVLKDMLKDKDVRVCACAASCAGRVLRSVGRSIGSRLERRLLVTLLVGSLNHRSKVVLKQVQKALNDAVGNCVWVSEIVSEISVATDASEVKSATARAAMFEWVAEALQFEALHGHPSSNAYPNLAVVLKRAISERDRDPNTRNAAERGLAALVATVEHLASQSAPQRDPFADVEGPGQSGGGSGSENVARVRLVRAQSAGSVKHHQKAGGRNKSNVMGSQTPQGKALGLKRPNSFANVLGSGADGGQGNPTGCVKGVLDQLKQDKESMKAVQRVESMSKELLSQIHAQEADKKMAANQVQQKENTHRQDTPPDNTGGYDQSKRRIVRRATGGLVGDMVEGVGTPNTKARPPRSVSSRGFDDPGKNDDERQKRSASCRGFEEQGKTDDAGEQRLNQRAQKAPGGRVAADKDKLENMWFELKYLLPSKRQVESKNDIEQLSSDVKRATHFLDEVEYIAKQAGSLKGAVSRWVLPYDDNTSTLDQAAPSRRTSEREETGDGRRFIKLCGGGTGKERLVSEAIALRHLVRVKLADDADLDQARQAVSHVSGFVDSLKQYAKFTNEDVVSVLKDLKV
jgi:hypothetical protein